MLQFKQPQIEPKEPRARWNIGIDRRHVAIYVGLALIAGFAGGFLAARSATRKESATPALTRDNRTPAQQGASDSPQIEYRKVSRIIRADTIEVEGVGPVRMLGIESPDGKSPREIYDIHGQRALGFVEKTLVGREVRLDYDSTSGDKDAAGQMLAYVYTRDGTLVNAEMVRLGLAFVRSAEQFRLANEFRSYERDAMQSMRGVWGPSSGSPSTLASASSSSASSTDEKPKKLAPLPPSALGANIPAISAAPNTSLEQSVWVSPADKMYHKSTCDFLNKKKHAIAISEARSEGYTACSRCYASTVMKAP